MRRFCTRVLGNIVITLVLCCFLATTFAGTLHAEVEGAPMGGGILGEKTSGINPLISNEMDYVSTFTGEGGYSVPIEVPPGRNGLQPTLALKYKSNNRESWLGFGWQLELGAIEINTKKGVKYPGSAFVFRTDSGVNELVNIGGAEYRLKYEKSFSRFQKINGLDGRPMWQMTTTKGVRYIFGSSKESRLDNQDNGGKPDEIFRWCLAKVEDPNGNFMTITYTKDLANGQIYPQRLDYTGNQGLSPTNSVHFNFENSSDIRESYKPLFRVRTVSQLKNIEIKSQGKLVRRYDLKYKINWITKRALLDSVAFVGRDGVSVLRTSSFTYSSSAGALEDKGIIATLDLESLAK